MAKPLIELTKKEGFHWNSRTPEAFENIKKAVTTAPILMLPDLNIVFELECDASGKGVGAVLTHTEWGAFRIPTYLSQIDSKCALEGDEKVGSGFC